VANVKVRAREHSYDELAIVRSQDTMSCSWPTLTPIIGAARRFSMQNGRCPPSSIERTGYDPKPHSPAAGWRLYAPESVFPRLPTARDPKTEGMAGALLRHGVAPERIIPADSGGGTELMCPGHSRAILSQCHDCSARVCGLELSPLCRAVPVRVGFYEKHTTRAAQSRSCRR